MSHTETLRTQDDIAKLAQLNGWDYVPFGSGLTVQKDGNRLVLTFWNYGAVVEVEFNGLRLPADMKLIVAILT